MRIVAAVLLLLVLQPSPKGVKLERLSSADGQSVLGADAVIVIPLGLGLHPHGPHLSLGTDFVLAEHVAHRVMEAIPVAVAPPLAYQATDPTEIEAFARAVARSGPRRFYVVNASTATTRPLSAAAALLARGGILLRYSDFTPLIGAHGAEAETSVMLHIDAPSVNMDRVPGDASGAAAARGKIFLDSVVARIVQEVEALRRATPPNPQPAPADVPPAAASAEPRRPSGCTAGDERTITDLANRFNAHWATADADRLADLWADGGDLVHPDGVVERGRAIIRENRRDQFRRKEYRASKHLLRFGLIRCVSHEVAVADGKWELSSVFDAAGNPLPRGEGMTTVVLKKNGDTWLFEAYRYNVTLAQVGPKPPTLLKKPGYPDK